MFSIPAGILTVLILGVLALPAGAVLIGLGWRGRRVGDDVFCAGCGRELADPDAQKCPACGADLSDDASVRVGRRQRRADFILGGLAAMLLGLGLVTLGLRGSGVDWDKYAPNWWLVRRVCAEQPQAAGRTEHALTELVFRLSAGQLSADQNRKLVEQALRVQGDSARPWLTNWGAIIVAAHERGQTDEAQWQRYWKQALRQTLRVRPRAVAGEPLPLVVEWGHVRLETGAEDAGQPRFRLQLAAVSGALDGAPIALPATAQICDLSGSSAGQVALCLGMDGAAMPVLGTGPHTVQIRIEATMYDLDRGQTGGVRAAWLMELTAPFEVVAGGSATVTALNDPAARPAIERALQINDVRVSAGADHHPRLQLSGLWRPLPVNLAFDVVARSGNRQWPLGQVAMPQGSASTWTIGCPCPADFNLDSADLFFQPSPAAARRTVDITSIWGGELVFKSVAVTWEPGVIRPGK